MTTHCLPGENGRRCDFPRTNISAGIFFAVLCNFAVTCALHLGCGAGGHDFHFKQHFSVTGVDLSEGMLEIAKKTNPEITYIKGDMRNVKLNEKFDAVVIPDSIMYMSTLEDLSAALRNAAAHMKPLGVLLIVARTKEDFRTNNFAYTGEYETFT
jgi:predicted TPR repeat methyltransferase